MNKDYVSIIIPTYNRAKCILNSIESVLNQTYPFFELLIVDDGSTDNTEEVVHGIEDDRVKYIKMPQNGGAAAARNYGISVAQYDYIAFQDSDDWWDPEKLDKEMRCITSNPSFAMVYCQMRCIEVNEKGAGKEIAITPADAVPDSIKSGRIYEYLLKANYVGAPTMLIRRECLDKVGRFDEAYNALEDWDLVLRISRDYPIGFVAEPLFTYNMQPADSVSYNHAAYFDSRCRIVGTYKNDMIKYGVLSSVIEDILTRADSSGLLERVGKLMELYLQ